MPVTLLASACPLPQVFSVTLLKANASGSSGNAIVARNITSGDIHWHLNTVNPNATNADLISRYGAGAIGIPDGVSKITITAGTGLLVNVSAGHAMIGGPVEIPAATTVVVPNNTARVWIWLRNNGQIVTATTTAAPSGEVCLLGSCVTASGAVTSVDTSGVVWFRGGHAERETADAGAPVDSPPASWRGTTKTAFSTYRWDGATHRQTFTPVLTADPATPQTGDNWYRSDLHTLVVQGVGTFAIGGAGTLNYRGAYNNGSTYAVGDWVYYTNGSSYYCIAPSTGNLPTDPTHWSPLALAGAAGTNGTNGTNGAQGIQGPAGPSGAQGYNDRGPWNSGTTYAAYDVSQSANPGYGTSSWIALGATTGDLPSTSPTKWRLFASGGAAGPTGANGTNGSVIRTGSGVPSSGLGADTDYYKNTATGDYYLKSGGAWTLQGNDTGPAGAQGLQGLSAPIRGTFEMYAYGTLATGADPVPRIIPDNWGGTITFDKMHLYLSTTGSSNTSVTIELYHGTGAFSATYTSQTFTLGSGVSELVVSSPTGLTTILPGDKIRARITSAGSGASDLLISPTFLHQ